MLKVRFDSFIKTVFMISAVLFVCSIYLLVSGYASFIVKFLMGISSACICFVILCIVDWLCEITDISIALESELNRQTASKNMDADTKPEER